MNERQKKKWIKQNLVRIKKIHPSEYDVVFFIPDFEHVDIDVAVEFYNCCIKTGMFDHCSCALMPCNIKKMDVDAAQIYIDKIQEVINEKRKQK